MSTVNHSLLYVGISFLYEAQGLGASHELMSALVGICYAALAALFLLEEVKKHPD